MDNRSTLTLIAALTIITAVVQVLGIIGWGLENQQVYTVSGIIRLTVIFLIIQDGTLFKSKIYRALLLLCSGIVVFGALWKILHWPQANVILLTGFASTALFYTIRFLLKQGKGWLDILKWGWVLSICIAFPFKIFHWYPANILLQIQSVFMLALLLAFLRKLMLEREELKT